MDFPIPPLQRIRQIVPCLVTLRNLAGIVPIATIRSHPENMAGLEFARAEPGSDSVRTSRG
jgi:hypothetical protein